MVQKHDDKLFINPSTIPDEILKIRELSIKQIASGHFLVSNSEPSISDVMRKRLSESLNFANRASVNNGMLRRKFMDISPISRERAATLLAMECHSEIVNALPKNRTDDPSEREILNAVKQVRKSVHLDIVRGSLALASNELLLSTQKLINILY